MADVNSGLDTCCCSGAALLDLGRSECLSTACSPLPGPTCLCRSLTDLFAADPECAAKAPEKKLAGGLARTMAFAGAGIDDDLELKKLQAGALAAFLC